MNTEPAHVTFAVGPSRSWGTARRGLSVVAAVAALGVGVWIIAGALAVGPSRGVAVIGFVFVAAAAAIWWVVLRGADEVTVSADLVRWHSLFGGGSASLADLRSVTAAPWPRVGLEVSFERASFDLLPARGVEEFLAELRRLRPDVPVEYPDAARRLQRVLPRGRLER